MHQFSLKCDKQVNAFRVFSTGFWKDVASSVLIRAPLSRFFPYRVGDILHHFSINFGVILGFGGYRWAPQALQKST